MVTRSCGARSVIPELSHALEVEAEVRTQRSRSSRTRLLLLWPWYALGDPGAAACAYCCYGHGMHSVELLCAPIVVAVVCARWSCCARPLLTIGRPSEAPSWESAWYPGEAPGESGGSSFFFPSPYFP